MDAFSTLMKRYLDRAELGVNAFERRVRPGSQGVGFVSQIINGIHTPPMDKMPLWAEELHLTVAETQEFMVAAALEHCHPLIRDDYRRLRHEMTQLKALVPADVLEGLSRGGPSARLRTPAPRSDATPTPTSSPHSG